MKEHQILDLTDIEHAAKISHALSSAVRLTLLRLISDKPLNLSEISALLGIPVSSTALHVKTLEEAGLVITRLKPGVSGFQKVCALNVATITFKIQNSSSHQGKENVLLEYIPIGNYFDFHVNPPCGIVTDKQPIDSEDRTNGFYMPEHAKAQLIWFTTGYLEYRISTERIRKLSNIHSFSFTMELCSEAPGYRNDWKSDIDLLVNSKLVATVHSQGDYGGRQGKLNPSWWDHNNTQYGILHNLLITHEGTYLDEMKESSATIASLELLQHDYISLRISVRSDSQFVGGVNLFGEKFGDYPQNIVLKVHFD